MVWNAKFRRLTLSIKYLRILYAFLPLYLCASPVKFLLSETQESCQKTISYINILLLKLSFDYKLQAASLNTQKNQGSAFYQMLKWF